MGSARWRRPFQLPAPQFHQRIPPCDLVLRHGPRSRTPQRSPLHPPCGIFPCQLDFRHHPTVRRRALHRGCAGTLRRPELFAQIRSPGGDRGRVAAGACSGQRGSGGLRQYQNRRRCDLRRRHSQVASADQSLPPAHPDQLLDEADHRRGACRRTVRRHRRRSGGQPDHGDVVRQRHPRRKGQYGELQVLQRQQFRFVVPDLQVRRRLDAGSAGTCVCRNWPK